MMGPIDTRKIRLRKCKQRVKNSKGRSARALHLTYRLVTFSPKAFKRLRDLFVRSLRRSPAAPCAHVFDATRPTLLVPPLRPLATTQKSPHAHRVSGVQGGAVPVFGNGALPTRGHKTALPSDTTPDGAAVRLSMLTAADGHSWTLSQSLAQGAFGKFRLAMDEAAQVWAVAKFRSTLSKHQFEYDA